VPGRDEFHYGLLPPHFFNEILKTLRAFRQGSKMAVTPR
jgi:hypothetical protein